MAAPAAAVAAAGDTGDGDGRKSGDETEEPKRRLFNLCDDDDEMGVASSCHGSVQCVEREWDSGVSRGSGGAEGETEPGSEATGTAAETVEERRQPTLVNASHTAKTFAADVPARRKVIFDMSNNGWDQVGWGNNAHSITELLSIAFALRRRMKLIYSGCHPETQTQTQQRTRTRTPRTRVNARTETTAAAGGKNSNTNPKPKPPAPCAFDPSIFWQYVDGSKWGFTAADADDPTMKDAKLIDEEYVAKLFGGGKTLPPFMNGGYP